MTDKALEERVQEGEKARKKIELMGAFLGSKLGENATPGTSYTDPVRYMEAIAQYASEARKKASSGSNPLDEFYTFNPKSIETSMKKVEKYTVNDYISSAKDLGLDALDENETELLSKYKDQNYFEVVKDLKRKEEDKKLTPEEKTVFGLLKDLQQVIVKSVDDEITKYAREKMYLPNRRIISQLEKDALQDPNGESAKKLEKLKGDSEKLKGLTGEEQMKAQDEYKKSAKEAGLQIFDHVNL